jgi:hypothetical protein
VEYRAKKLTFFFIAYYHDPRLIRKVGGLIRVFDLADNLVKSGHQVTLFLPKLGAPRKQTLAEVVEVPFVDIPLLRPLSFHFISTILLLVNMTTSVDFLYVRQMNSFLPLFLAKLYHIPTIFEIPNDPYLAYQSYSLTKRSIIRFTDRLSMLMADIRQNSPQQDFSLTQWHGYCTVSTSFKGRLLCETGAGSVVFVCGLCRLFFVSSRSRDFNRFCPQGIGKLRPPSLSTCWRWTDDACVAKESQ